MGREYSYRKKTTPLAHEREASVSEKWGRESDDGAPPPCDQQQQILRDRAHALARESARSDPQEDTVRVVEFIVARERYAVESIFVRGVRQIQQLTPIPCTPAFVLGIVSVHGRILSVVDLRAFFDLPPLSRALGETVLILRTEKLELGVLVDEVLGSEVLPLKSIKAVAPARFDIRRAYVRGIVDEQLIVLDAEQILSDRRMIIGGDEVEL